jgi:hypothetical protein
MKVTTRVPSRKIDVEIDVLDVSRIFYTTLSQYLDDIIKKTAPQTPKISISNFLETNKIGEYIFSHRNKATDTTEDHKITITDPNDINRITIVLDIYRYRVIKTLKTLKSKKST